MRSFLAARDRDYTQLPSDLVYSSDDESLKGSEDGGSSSGSDDASENGGSSSGSDAASDADSELEGGTYDGCLNAVTHLDQDELLAIAHATSRAADVAALAVGLEAATYLLVLQHPDAW